MIGVALYLGVSILIGGICCFFGKKLYFPVLAAVIFFSVSGQIATNGQGNRITVAALVIGAVTAWLAVSLYKLGVFLLGALLGAGLGVMVLGIFRGDDFPHYWLLVVLLMLLAGACALRWNGLFIMLSTAYRGAEMMALPLCVLLTEFSRVRETASGERGLSPMLELHTYLNGPFAVRHETLVFGAVALITVAGFWYQKKTAGNE